MELLQIIEGAKAKATAAALAVWERDEKQDRGSCGGAMLELDQRSALFKTIKQTGCIQLMDGFVQLGTPEGIRSQNADIPQAQYRAFKAALEEAGQGKAIKRFWTYID